MHLEESYILDANNLIPDTWSDNANLASLSLGVIKSNFLNSRIFPHQLATWLSAAVNLSLDIAFLKKFIFLSLKIPCLKSEKITPLLFDF